VAFVFFFFFLAFFFSVHFMAGSSASDCGTVYGGSVLFVTFFRPRIIFSFFRACLSFVWTATPKAVLQLLSSSWWFPSAPFVGFFRYVVVLHWPDSPWLGFPCFTVPRDFSYFPPFF